MSLKYTPLVLDLGRPNIKTSSVKWGSFFNMANLKLENEPKPLSPTRITHMTAWLIAEINGRPVAMAIALPNLNEAIADLDGRLLPFGWAKLLWRLKVKTTKTVRLPLLGVRRQYHDSVLGAALAFSVIDAVRRHLISRGVTAAELSWILEDNSGVRQVVESLNATVSKVYRVYEREL